MILLEELKLLLEKDERLISEGKLLKNRIVELALKLDKDLIKLLLSNDRIKKHFFNDIDGVLVFNREKFMKFVDNKEFLPDSYTAFKNKIGLATDDGKYIGKSKEVVLVWPYKDCILEGGQEKPDEKRKEIFHNEILAPDEIDRLLEPKVFTDFKMIDKDGEHKLHGFRRDPEKNKMRGLPEDTITDNLIIKGNNLLVLHSLLKEFRGKVKLIYIDPPYNTGNDEFKYNDNFNHSTWLTFMKNRLEVAKELLKEDGAIFVQCDDNEQAYLKVLMDEIFGAENHQVTLYIQVRYEQKTLSEKNYYQKLIEQIHIYSKGKFLPNREKEEYDITKFEWEIQELSKGTKIKLGQKEAVMFKPGEYKIKKVKPGIDKLKETWASGTVLKNNASGKFFNDYISPRCKIDGYGILYKVYGIGEDGLGYRYFTGPKKEGATKGKFYSGVPIKRREEIKEGYSFKLKVIDNFYNYADSFGNCRHEGGVELRSGKKPEILLKKVLDIATQKGDIVLDFFMGTGTTCAVAHKMRRQYIGIEQLDYGENSAVVRLKNVINGDETGISAEVGWNGGGDFVYMELMKLNEVFVDKIQEAETTEELLSIWKDMKRNGFLSYRVDQKLFDENIEEFKTLNLEEQKRLLIETLDKNDLYVNYSEIDDEVYNVSEEDKRLNEKFYGER
jgi:adenine-specific DNA-methyltransferase